MYFEEIFDRNCLWHIWSDLKKNLDDIIKMLLNTICVCCTSIVLINLNILTWFWSSTCSCTINPGCPPNYYPQANYNMEILLLFEKFMPSRKYPSSIIEKKVPDFPVFGSLLSKQLTRQSLALEKYDQPTFKYWLYIFHWQNFCLFATHDQEYTLYWHKNITLKLNNKTR